jgi:hypothetical protein
MPKSASALHFGCPHSHPPSPSWAASCWLHRRLQNTPFGSIRSVEVACACGGYGFVQRHALCAQASAVVMHFVVPSAQHQTDAKKPTT